MLLHTECAVIFTIFWQFPIGVLACMLLALACEPYYP